jgi:NAD(P)-dependent dehydrogenase (short-subunit alcohol dehydrogenase family)
MPDSVVESTVVVTGANTGIGKETAIGLAAAGARVVITSRDERRGADAVAEIRARSGNDRVEVMTLDLADFASVRAFAAQLAGTHERLDVLVHNAGLVLGARHETVDGNEATLQVNHLGPFLLTALLRDRLVGSAPSRVVVVASDAHKQARRGLELDDLQSTRRYRAFRVYAKTKLANILFTRELARRLTGTGVTANSLHPGFVASRFARDGDTGLLGRLAMPLLRPVALSPEQGARTSIFVASEPSLAAITGEYWYKCALATPSASARDDDAARQLWDVSEQLVGGAARGDQDQRR